MTTLGEATSKVVVSPEYVDYYKAGMTRSKRTRLRRQKLVEHILSKPAGSQFTVSELRKLLHFTTDANAWAFLQRAIRDKVVVKMDLEGSRRGFSLATDQKSKVVKPPNATPPAGNGVLISHELYTVPKLGEFAKEWAWTNNSDSLREFITYLRETK